MSDLIDWELLGQAVSFYQRLGYTAVDVPWWAPRSVVQETCHDPDRIMDIHVPGEPVASLVGSAEQSFMYLRRTGSLSPGRYVACTPCFRNEPVADRLHLQRFMKVELFDNRAATFASLTINDVLADAGAFFRRYVDHESLVKVRTQDGWDLELAGIEIGSYGIRRSAGDDHAWVYGTGLAEPRFSTARSLQSRRTI